ncbi:hypothetical protein Droror1_Dr00022332 [Drosera rotundifolia]
MTTMDSTVMTVDSDGEDGLRSGNKLGGDAGLGYDDGQQRRVEQGRCPAEKGKVLTSVYCPDSLWHCKPGKGSRAEGIHLRSEVICDITFAAAATLSLLLQFLQHRIISPSPPGQSSSFTSMNHFELASQSSFCICQYLILKN